MSMKVDLARIDKQYAELSLIVRSLNGIVPIGCIIRNTWRVIIFF